MEAAFELLVAPLDEPPTNRREAGGILQLGRSHQCQVAFSGPNHDMVSGRHAQLEWDGQRLAVRDLGSSNGTFVNERRITGLTVVEPGDWIRLGGTGPSVRFLGIDRSRRTPLGGSRREEPLPAEEYWTPPNARPAIQAPRSATARTTHWLSLIAVGLALAAVAVALAALIRFGPSQGRPIEAQAAAEDPLLPGTVAAGEPRPPEFPKPAALPQAVPATRQEDFAAVVPQPQELIELEQGPDLDDWEPIARGVRLLVAEHPQGVLASAIGTAYVLSSDCLLTSAVTAVDLAVLQRQGWSVWCVDPASQKRCGVRSIRVHAGFEQFSKAPQARVYFDVAQLTLDPPLAENAILTAEPGEVEAGQTVFCLGLDHQPGTRITKFDHRQVRAWEGKVLAVTRLGAEGSGPRLLHLQGTWSEDQAGAIVVTADGRLVGLYVVSSPEDAPLRIHYGPLLDGLILAPSPGDRPSQLWVPPVLPAAPNATQPPER